MVEYNIDTPELIDLTRYVDDRGSLVELLRISWEVCPHPIRQVYMVHDRKADVRRCWHKHAELWDLFTIVHGTAVFGIVNEDSGFAKRYVLSDEKPQLLVVPPGFYHGWCSLTDDTLLVSLASHEYNRDNPDEVRIPPDSLREWFHNRDPFDVWAK